MNVFELRNQLIEDYDSYIRSFIRISDQKIFDYVQKSLDDGLLWPDPLIQLNPTFEAGTSIAELIARGVLHEECQHIFCKKREDGTVERKLKLHRHQSEAIEKAQSGKSYVLTTGTGSGKSLTYIIPIVNHVLRRGSGRGIQAIVVYPMNALANSQEEELTRFLHYGYPDGKSPVTFARYTGQEKEERRREICKSPPDILLTNYVMLEYILTRPREKELVRASQGLRFLVLDELHTYRGRQGADVALLIRRVREGMNAPDLQCIGTSATLSSRGTFDEQREKVADVASVLFGTQVEADSVIGETLRRATPDRNLNDPTFLDELATRVADRSRKPSSRFSEFISDPLSIWIESVFGVTRENGSRLTRAKPIGLGRPHSLDPSKSAPEGAAFRLAASTGLSVERCLEAIQEALLAGYACENPETGLPAFAFRLHQFISKGDTVYTSLEPEAVRAMTVYGQKFVPGDRTRILLPLVFCRECGQEYYAIRKSDAVDGVAQVHPRPFTEQYDDDKGEAGFLYYSTDNPWSDVIAEIVDRLPDDFVETEDGVRFLRKEQAKHLPVPLFLTKLGQIVDPSLADIKMHFLESPFRFCLKCGVSYSPNQDDFAKLSPLATEGRSTATTILSLSAIRRLHNQPGLDSESKKLLSFTDNRQDASLQAGHFNDFVEIGLLRSAILAAAEQAGSEGIGYDELPKKVFDALKLPKELYAQDPTVQFNAEKELTRAFRNVLAYRIYRDLKRGWRVTSPNLEQCGLLEIRYESLEELCCSEEHWQGVHPALVTASPEKRIQVARTLLDYMRRELAIKVDYLDPLEQESIKQQSRQKLIEPWEIDESENMEKSRLLFPRVRSYRTEGRENVYVSSRGGYGKYLRRHGILSDIPLKTSDVDVIIPQLLTILSRAGLVEQVMELPDKTPGYQLPASAMRWHFGDGTRPLLDPIRVPTISQNPGTTNPFFIAFYTTVAKSLVGIKAKEHTAQVPANVRQEREKEFRKAELPILYCSPTMELGVDIATLNVVNMRNVPPTPANYAQRSGRAGRSGQPALVFTYCTTGSPHDQYFFKRADLMVSGSVNPPRLDLANEDLVRAHVHAVWLAEAELALGDSLKEVLELPSAPQKLSDMPVKADVLQCLLDPGTRSHAIQRAENMLASLKKDLEHSDWYSETWLEDTLKQIALSFEASCYRWKDLYLSASNQQVAQNAIVMDASRSSKDKDTARRLRHEAEEQRKLLLDIENRAQSDFYSYRYFASEGFLPGYNFPRLPLSAYIPARSVRQTRDEFLSRPRFLAISEFGPGAIIYHEGARYEVTKVILPVGERQAGEEVITRQAKLCPQCGYLHPITSGAAFDNCERCLTKLDQPIKNLFRLQNVVTRRRQRINSDEEERMRRGYEILTGVRFEDRGAGPSYQKAVLEREGEILANLAFGQSATIWRINLGWRRRKEKELFGFILDVERGTWVAEKKEQTEETDPISNRTQRVVPYVEDRRNSLLFTPEAALSKSEMASLAAALKSAIQVVYSLEDSELSVEPLPTEDRRQHLVFYESSEGGAGVLRQLLADRQAISRMATEALSICHFDPDTGDNLGKPPLLREECTAACYDCLMSYGNQRDHEYLDRHAIRDLLLGLANATLEASPTTVSRPRHLESLMASCESDLEMNWLRYLESNAYRLPTHAQRSIPECGTRPDFMYLEAGRQVAVYVDGPLHDDPQRQERDATQIDCMRDLGYTVIRFRYDQEWDTLIARYPSIFGVKV